MDSSVGAYLMDENKNLLSIQEFRDKLIKGKKVLINEDAILPNDVYLHYMAKNLFLFNCTYASSFNDDTKDNASCSLYPKSYLDTDIKDSRENIVSNPEYFWAKPK
jgi:hypothetical protein